jgi:hypothetical protein
MKLTYLSLILFMKKFKGRCAVICLMYIAYFILGLMIIYGVVTFMDKQQKLASTLLYKWWRATRRYNEVDSLFQKLRDWLFPRRVSFEFDNGEKIILFNPTIKSFETTVMSKPYDGLAQIKVVFDYKQAKKGCSFSNHEDHENELNKEQ